MSKIFILQSKNDLSKKSKNGIAFLLSGTIIWLIITIIFLQLISIETKNIFTFFSTGLMFPLSIGISKLIKSEWRSPDNPLSDLGLVLNLAQLMYFPLIFWAFAKSPEQMITFFAVITGAHFFPYGWFYNTKAYYIMAPILSISMMLISTLLDSHNLWVIPLSMVLLFLILITWLYIDFKKGDERYKNK